MHYKIEWNEQLLGGAVIIYGPGVEPKRNVFSSVNILIIQPLKSKKSTQPQTSIKK
jgi:hypothetical protein